MLLTGFVLTAISLYLLLFTEIANSGMVMIGGIVTLLTIGLLLLIPAKVFIIVYLMNQQRKRSEDIHR